MPKRIPSFLDRIRPKRAEKRPPIRPRRSAHGRGYGRRWQRLRWMVLADQPICQTPGCGRPASQVDHIIPKRQGGTDARENLQALCRSCHSRKTGQEGAFGREVPKIVNREEADGRDD